MYLDYWSLGRNPFDSVPDPSMYFTAHATVESTVAELLFAIGEGNECLAVVVGEVGLGKTMALRVVLNLLDPKLYQVAFVTNPDVTFLQLLREILGQLKGEACSIRNKEQLLEEFNRTLFETADVGKKVLVFIDEGNSMSSRNLESLRLLTNMQEDTQNLLTLVLAGQPKLGRMLEDRRRANLFQRIGVYCRLEPLASPEIVRDYIEHRLERAGSLRTIFDDSAIQAICEHSNGVPRLINRVCKLALKAGETNGVDYISGNMIEEIAERFQPRRGRRGRSRQQVQDSKPLETQAQVAKEPIEVEASRPDATDQEAVTVFDWSEGIDESCEMSGSDEPEMLGTPELAEPEKPVEAGAVNELPNREGGRQVDASESPDGLSWEDGEDSYSQEAPPDSSPQSVEEESSWISSAVLDQLRDLPDLKSQRRLAGQLAAQELREHPERFQSSQLDPVIIWDQLRSEILRVAL